MAARKSKSRSTLVSAICTTLLAPLAVSLISSTLKHEKLEAVIESPHIIVRPMEKPHETPATLLPPVGSTVSAYRDIAAEDHLPGWQRGR